MSQTDFGCSHVGTNQVILTVTDVNGNQSTATATVTVVDDVAPVASAQTLRFSWMLAATLLFPDDIDDGSSDACGIASLSLSQTDFGCSHVGTNQVILTVTDVNGNQSTATATVTVVDDVAPVASAQDIEILLDASGNASISTDDIDDGSSDACGIASLSLSQTDFGCSHVGTNQVILTVTDVNGNQSTATATVTVVDDVAPVASAQDIESLLDASGNAAISTDDIDDGSSDACVCATLSLSQTDFGCSHVGTNQVILTVTDVSNGSQSTATATVTVVDDVAPVASAQDSEILLDACLATLLFLQMISTMVRVTLVV